MQSAAVTFPEYFPVAQSWQLPLQRNVPENPTAVVLKSLVKVMSIFCPLEKTAGGIVLPLLPLPICGAAVDVPSYIRT
jgi:hypothetical protein